MADHTAGMDRNTAPTVPTGRIAGRDEPRPLAVVAALLTCLVFCLAGSAAGWAGDPRSAEQAALLLNQGHSLFISGENGRALQSYTQAAILYGKRGDKRGQGLALVAAGHVHLRRGDGSRAAAVFAQARDLFGVIRDNQGEGLVCLGLGNLHLRTRSYHQAREYYLKAESLLGEAGDTAGQARVYRNLGEIAMRTGDNPRAFAYYERALSLFSHLGDTVGEGNALRSIGEAHYYVGDNERAMDYLARALALFRKAAYPLGEADVYRRQGQIHLRRGESDRALELFRREALPRYEAVEEPIGQADIHKDIGDIHYYRRDYARAMEAYDRAEPLYSRIDDPIGLGNVSRSMGDIFMRTGDKEKAAAAYRKAEEFYRRADSPIGLGNVFHSLGDLFLQDRELEEAAGMYRRALPYYEKATAVQGQGNIYRGLGDVASAAGRFEEAVEFYNRALVFYNRANSLYGQGRTYQALGDVEAEGERATSALAMYDRAMECYRKMGDIELEAYALFRKARVLQKGGEKGRALALYEDVLAKLEQVRRQVVFAELKRGYLERVYDLYEEAAVFMLENSYDVQAFRVIEAVKARTFLDQLSESRVDIEKGIDPELRQRRDALERDLDGLSKSLAQENQRSRPDERKIAVLREKAASTAEKLEAVRREVRFRNPLYASVQYPEPVSLAKLREGILNPDEVLVEYFLTAAGIYCFAIDKDRHVVRRLPGTAVELEKDLDAFLANIQGALRGESFDRAQAHLLYERLLKPLEDRLGEKTIIIVPHGKLAFLPFESLLVRHEGGEKYLTERHRIKYIQSATVLAVLRTMPKRGNVAKSFLGFGDPVYDYESYRRGREEEAGQGEDTKERAFRQWTKRGYLRAGGRLARLEGSGREIREIGALFRRHDLAADCLLRAEAREERAKDRRLAQYAYLHFSTHGILGPRFQAIALSQLPQTEEDGFLTLGEIMNCRYNAELVVLSACETGLGRVDRGEGVTGLTRAVMYAGTPAAVVSLWSVSDDGTTELMIQFYRNLLQKGLGKEESLRMAKIAMIRRSHTAEASSDAASLRSVRVLEKKVKGDYGHPFFWAAFVMYGE